MTAVKGREKPILIARRSWLGERVAVGRADRLVDGALARPVVASQADLGQVGVVDVAGEDHDRGRRLCRDGRG